MYINNVANCQIPSYLRSASNDIAMWYMGSGIPLIYRIKVVHEAINKFCSDWDLSINIEKMLCIFNEPTCGSQLFVYNFPIGQVKEYKYLAS